jgi:hypothetical protein
MAGEATTARAARQPARDMRGGAPAGDGDFVDELIDELLPESLDWRLLVQRYPHAAVAVAAAAGFWIGRTKGSLVMAALTSYVAAQFGEAVIGMTEGPQDVVDPRH